MRERSKSQILAELKRHIAPAASGRMLRPHGLDGTDAMPGFATGLMHEILPTGPDTAAAAGFTLRLLAAAIRGQDTDRPVMWVTTPKARHTTGRLYGPGLAGLGLDPGALIVVVAPRDRETLWTLEEALGSGTLAAVAGEVGKMDFTPSRRLSLAARRTDTPLFVLRPWETAGTSAAATRWRIHPGAGAPDAHDSNAPGAGAWQAQLLRARDGREGTWPLTAPSPRSRIPPATRTAQHPAASHSAQPEATSHPARKAS